MPELVVVVFNLFVHLGCGARAAADHRISKGQRPCPPTAVPPRPAAFPRATAGSTCSLLPRGRCRDARGAPPPPLAAHAVSASVSAARRRHRRRRLQPPSRTPRRRCRPVPSPAVCLCAPITVDAWLAAVELRRGRAWPTEAAEARLASGGGGAACGPRRRWSRAQPAETAKPRGAGRRAEEALAAEAAEAAEPRVAGGGGSARGERRRWSARGRRRRLLPRREEEAGRCEGIERR